MNAPQLSVVADLGGRQAIIAAFLCATLAEVKTAYQFRGWMLAAMALPMVYDEQERGGNWENLVVELGEAWCVKHNTVFPEQLLADAQRALNRAQAILDAGGATIQQVLNAAFDTSTGVN